MNVFDGNITADTVVVYVISGTGNSGIGIIVRIPELLIDVGGVGRSSSASSDPENLSRHRSVPNDWRTS